MTVPAPPLKFFNKSDKRMFAELSFAQRHGISTYDIDTDDWMPLFLIAHPEFAKGSEQ